MPRCLTTVMAALALAAPALVFAQSATSASQFVPGRAIPLPTQSLRGEVVFGQPPEVTLNGAPARLAPGARIRDMDNRLALSGNLAGQKFTVNYTVDTYGLLMNVWLLNADEAKQLWPTTPKEAASWSYDPVSHMWAKP